MLLVCGAYAATVISATTGAVGITSNIKLLYTLLTLSKIKTSSEISTPMQIRSGSITYAPTTDPAVFFVKKENLYFKIHLTIQLGKFHLTFK